MKRNLFSLCSALLLLAGTCAFCGCRETAVSTDDFSLTLECVLLEDAPEAESDSEILYIGYRGTLTAVFENKSGRSLNVTYSGGENFSGFVHLYFYEEGEEPDTSYVSNAVEENMKKDLRLTEETDFLTLAGKSYRAFALVSFTCGEERITLRSETLSL